MIPPLMFAAGWLLALAFCAYTAPTEEARRFGWSAFAGSLAGALLGGPIVGLIGLVVSGLT
ncbi:hypothetical protein [Nocardia sp. NPDC051833]|uniref:hypothetical protein n=1 Tax=Nocardia sp. NPDC051833 TaxID=3155674 RepID=UPI00342FCDC5